MDNAGNSKTYWKIMKMLIKSSKGSGTIPPLQNIVNNDQYDEFVFEDEQKCNILNEYFSLISSVDDENTQIPEFRNRTDSHMDSIYVEVNEIIDIIQTLDPNKASGA